MNAGTNSKDVLRIIQRWSRFIYGMTGLILILSCTMLTLLFSLEKLEATRKILGMIQVNPSTTVFSLPPSVLVGYSWG